jgi:hypothetical protein
MKRPSATRRWTATGMLIIAHGKLSGSEIPSCAKISATWNEAG